MQQLLLLLGLLLGVYICLAFPEDPTPAISDDDFNINFDEEELSDNSRGARRLGIRRKPWKPARPSGPSAPALSIADQVVMLVHNECRITHDVPLLTFNPTLQQLAQICANYYAVTPPGIVDQGVGMDPQYLCPAINTTSNTIGISLRSEDRAAGRPSLADNFRLTIYDFYVPDGYDSFPTFDEISGGTYTAIELVNMIWKSTTDVGCARSTFVNQGQNSTVVCLYWPKANFNSESAFAANVFQERY